MAYCGHCGAERVEGDKFCGGCGAVHDTLEPASTGPGMIDAPFLDGREVASQIPWQQPLGDESVPAPSMATPASLASPDSLAALAPPRGEGTTRSPSAVSAGHELVDPDSGDRRFAVRAKTRAQTRLSVTTALHGSAALGVVRNATELVRGGGASLLTTGMWNIGAQVHVEQESADRLSLSITSGKRLVELCTFSATVSPNGAGTTLTVGGLETYKTSQEKLYFVIPAGPKKIMGFAPYKKFLAAVEQEILRADPAATVTIGIP